MICYKWFVHLLNLNRTDSDISNITENASHFARRFSKISDLHSDAFSSLCSPGLSCYSWWHLIHLMIMYILFNEYEVKKYIMQYDLLSEYIKKVHNLPKEKKKRNTNRRFRNWLGKSYFCIHYSVSRTGIIEKLLTPISTTLKHVLLCQIKV